MKPTAIVVTPVIHGQDTHATIGAQSVLSFSFSDRLLVTDQELEKVKLDTAAFHGEGNHTVSHFGTL